MFLVQMWVIGMYVGERGCAFISMCLQLCVGFIRLCLQLCVGLLVDVFLPVCNFSYM